MEATSPAPQGGASRSLGGGADRSAREAQVKILRTRGGARVLHGAHVLSELRALPGPTHSVFDVLAAAVVLCEPAGPLLMLGFAGGGMVAPLRALAWDAPIEAVDLSLAAVPTFRALSRAWAGEVRVRRAEAGAFLARGGRAFGCVVEDLSQQLPGDVVKPAVSFGPLPAQIARRLAPGGVCVINLLPQPGWSLASTRARLLKPHTRALRVVLDDFQNEVLLAGAQLPPAAAAARTLRLILRTLGSRQAERFTVRTVR